MTNKIATEQYLINLAGGGTGTPTKCATKSKVEFYGLRVSGTYKDTQLVKEVDILNPGFLYVINVNITIKNTVAYSVYFNGNLDIYIDGLQPDGFIAYPLEDIQLTPNGNSYLSKTFDIRLDSDLANISNVHFLNGTYRNCIVKVDADGVINVGGATAMGFVDVEVNQAYAPGDMATVDITITV